ncbi:unnamed protein product [Chrysodeixis includens]|uniref:Peptidase S1 domain-containing protein n=1 Tax=Chrysodeixis includens TaxID=689277 RepID=A0A9P0BP02_CHRIL|nr:unnamed protein product [Chrysodeixis includens]
MRVIALLALCFAAVAAVPSSDSRIAGGSLVTIDKYPSSASIIHTWDGVHLTFNCGGTIINNRSILTAGHCIYYYPSMFFRIRVGSSFGQTGGELLAVARQFQYPGYNDDNFRYDIAILHTATFITYNNNVSPTPIAGAGFTVPDNQSVWATGWQMTQDASAGQTSLRQISDAQVLTVNGSICNSRYEDMEMPITAEMLCTAYPQQDNGQCNGVFGAGIYHANVLVGVTTQCFTTRPTVNTRVSSYVQWIQANA